MHEQLRVLILEDNPDDAELVLHELEQAGFALEVERVETEEAFLAGLSAEVDVILADYALPQFGAIEALALVKQRGVDIPFIIVSGVISEEKAVEAMKQGAADYLLKDRLTRLESAVRHTLAQRQLRREKQQAYLALQRSEALNRAVLGSLTAHLAVLDQDGRIIAVNEAWASFAHEQCEEPLLRPDVGTNYLEEGSRQAAQHGDEVAAQIVAGIEAVLAASRALYSIEYPCAWPEGRRWFLLQVMPLARAAGGVVVSHQDITDRKRAETERERLVQELEAKNAELERFTYTVSHDLKSPLVTIRGFLGLLQQDARAGDTERMNRDVEQIQNATETMSRLLAELLELSRIGRIANPSEDVSLTDLAREAVEMVAGRITARGVAVEIAPAMPVVVGDRVRLLEVFQNLVDNAVTFMGDQPAPRVEIGAQRNGAEVACYVRDNGMGIAPKYHEKVFGLFERLKADGEGTGIGLALVKRIVEVHGGRVWVESEGLGHGSTFWFTLSKNGASTDRPT